MGFICLLTGIKIRQANGNTWHNSLTVKLLTPTLFPVSTNPFGHFQHRPNADAEFLNHHFHFFSDLYRNLKLIFRYVCPTGMPKLAR